MQQRQTILVGVHVPAQLAMKLDEVCYRRQRANGSTRRVSRSEVVRGILERHFSAAAPAAPATAPAPTPRVRSRKPARDR